MMLAGHRFTAFGEVPAHTHGYSMSGNNAHLFREGESNDNFYVTGGR